MFFTSGIDGIILFQNTVNFDLRLAKRSITKIHIVCVSWHDNEYMVKSILSAEAFEGQESIF